MEGIKVGDMVLYDVEALSKLLNVQERTIRAYLRTGKLKGRKMARKWYVTEESLKAYFQQPEKLEIDLNEFQGLMGVQTREEALEALEGLEKRGLITLARLEEPAEKLRLGPPGEEVG